MKTIQIILTMTLFLVKPAFAQEMALNNNNTEKPVIAWESQIFDFGNVQKGKDAVTLFTFRNNSKEAVVIEKVKTSCGCTATEYPKIPVKPGEKASIKVSYDTNRPGAFSKSIVVNLSNSETPIVLKIKGSVI